MLSELRAALDWLSEIGIRYSGTRFGRYVKILDDLERARLAGNSLFLAACQFDAFPTLFEANELVTIHQGLGGLGLGTRYMAKLAELVAGPDSYIDENSSSSNGPRNAGFELSLIARMATAGLGILEYDGLADALVRLGSNSIVVECKRPQSRHGLPQAIDRARRQLAERYESSCSADATGLIALDITKVLNPNLAVAMGAPLQNVASDISEKMDSINRACAKAWDRVKEQRTAGIILRHSVLAWVRETKTMAWIHKYGIAPLAGRGGSRLAVVFALRDAVDRAVKRG